MQTTLWQRPCGSTPSGPQHDGARRSAVWTGCVGWNRGRAIRESGARRTYLLKADDVVFIGCPDIAVASTTGASIGAALPATTSVTVLEVDVPMQDEVSENCLEIHEVSTTVRNRPPRPFPRSAALLRCVARPQHEQRCAAPALAPGGPQG
jgi:hypothetical protein